MNHDTPPNKRTGWLSLGVIVAGPFMYGLSPEAIGSLFAVSAGLLIYVATGPLMSPLKEMTPIRGLSAVAAGATAALLLVLSPLHDHDHADHDHDHGPGSFVPDEGIHDDETHEF